MKKWIRSKTLWVNIIAVTAIILQAEYGFIVSPELELAALGVINLILRKYTKEGLTK
ncbi:unnamed protein product [marine sediment metagenome]|uniref:Uncharacterized protein n=1 Tax=marine sediment metagenome TaxID=412755 RepID=X0V5M2_9ZZZZ